MSLKQPLGYWGEDPPPPAFPHFSCRSMCPTRSTSSWSPSRPTIESSAWRTSWRSWHPPTGPLRSAWHTALRWQPSEVLIRRHAPWRWVLWVRGALSACSSSSRPETLQDSSTWGKAPEEPGVERWSFQPHFWHLSAVSLWAEEFASSEPLFLPTK